MKKIRVGINGMGRIGRTILREWSMRENPGFEVVAVNNPGEPNRYVHLLKYDSVHGRFKGTLSIVGNTLKINQNDIAFYTEKSPGSIPWDDNKIDIVIDATGAFTDKEALSAHLGLTVKKVIMCAPGSNLDGTFVVGINHELYQPESHHIISNASCTTNCLAPVAKVLEDNFGIESGLMTTVHSYTGDQRLLDSAHKDIRRARAAALSMIPTTTGAAKALGSVIPALNGKLDGIAVRVPTADVSMVDLVVNLKKEVTKKEINQAMLEASQGHLKGILSYTDEELVSIDFTGTKESSVFDASLTNVMTGKMVKVIAWYDNEVGFSNRVIDLTQHVGEKL